MADAVVYALLVGIDDYGGRVAALTGCRNDVAGFAELLRGLAPRSRLRLETLCDGEATRQAVIDRFTGHLGQAGAGDTAVFYFSGHGSVEPVEERFWRWEAGGENQTLVCADSRTPGIPDLADKEINALIATVAAGGAHVLAVLDCCHSGGATRAPGVRVRGAPPGPAPRTVAFAAAGAAAGGPPHVLLSACESTQLAMEMPIDGRPQGVFSAMLRRAVAALGPAATYRELLGSVSAAVRDRVSGQAPTGFAAEPASLDQPLFGGAVRPRPPGIMLERYRGRWWIDVGAVHGIMPPRDGETTVLAAPGGRIRVAEVEPARCRVTVDDGWQPDPGTRHPVTLVDVPLPAARVRLDGDPAGLALVRARIAGSAHVAEGDGDGLLVLAGGGSLVVARGDGSPYAEPVPATPDGADVIRRQLEHLSRWQLIERLDNPVSALAGRVRVHVAAAARGVPAPRFERATPLRPDRDGVIRLGYRRDGDGWAPPYVHVYLQNDTDEPLYCALLDLTDGFRVHSGLFRTALIPPRTTAVAAEGRALPVAVPKARLEAGGHEVRDTLKIVASGQRFRSEAFDLPPLGRPSAAPPAATRDSRGVLDRLAARAVTRDLVELDAGEHPEWTTRAVTLHTRL